MRLKQEQFVPFMIGVAVVTMVVIVISSFSFQNRQENAFHENVVTSDSLRIYPMRVLAEPDSITTINQQAGQNTVVVFWASWSEKSHSMLEEIQNYKTENDSLQVLAALVKDATESLDDAKSYPNFLYVDGIRLFNHLKVPGFPSYILIDKNGDVLSSKVGYEKGIGYDSLKVYLE